MEGTDDPKQQLAAQAQLKIVQAVLDGLNTGAPPDGLLEQILDQLLMQVGSQDGAIITAEQPGGGYRIRALRGRIAAGRFQALTGNPGPENLLPGEAVVSMPLRQNDRVLGYVVWTRVATDPPQPQQELTPLLSACALVVASTATISYANRARLAEQSLARFKRILDNTLDMIFMFDPQTLQFVYLNRGAVRAMGYQERELLQLRPCDIKPEYPEARFRALIEPLFSGREQALFFETVHRRKDGTEFPVDVMVQYMPDQGEHGLFVNIVRDLTERRRLDRMKREFVSTVSHELRTPLTSIRGALGLLQAQAGGQLPEKARQLIDLADSNSSRLVRLINDILDVEKVEAGKMNFEMAIYPVQKLVEQSIDANRSYADQYGVKLRLINRASEIWITVDQDRFEQVMTNLLSNATKYSPRGGEVDVAIRATGGRVTIAVRDRGPGIDPQLRNQLFQKFVQGDGSDARRRGGTGLGLSIVKAMTERMNGTVTFDSMPGQGATFRVTFPIQCQTGDSQAPSAGSPAPELPRHDDGSARHGIPDPGSDKRA